MRAGAANQRGDQGSDIKLVGQMQPYYEAGSLHPAELAGRPIAPLVTQVAVARTAAS